MRNPNRGFRLLQSVVTEAGDVRLRAAQCSATAALSLRRNPSPQLLAKILCSYFGGRTEVRWRKTVKEVFHTDFTSMYPSVCTLQGLWRFITSNGFSTGDATAQVRELLTALTADDLQDPAFWLRLPVVENALAGRLNATRYDYHPKLRQPALSRYAATNPTLWRWFAVLNEGRAYADQVKPFGFLYAAHLGRRAERKNQHPIAPFDRSPELAIRKAFDRVTGEPVASGDLQTYAEALAGYHLSPESKFRGGEAFDQGRTERRHVQARGMDFIGKEADQYEQAYLADANSELPIRYGAAQASAIELQADLSAAAAKFGDAAVGRVLGLPRSTVAKLKSGKVKLLRNKSPSIREGLRTLAIIEGDAKSREEAVLEGYRDAIRQHGSLRAAAKALGLDPSNMSRRLNR